MKSDRRRMRISPVEKGQGRISSPMASEAFDALRKSALPQAREANVQANYLNSGVGCD